MQIPFKVQEFSWTVTEPEIHKALEKEGAIIIFEQYDANKI